MKQKKVNTRSMVVGALLSAIAFILMFIETPLPTLMPVFVKLDISDLPALLGAFSLGPVYGIIIELLKNILHIIFKGTSTAYVGEFFNFTCGAVFALAAGLVYKFSHTRKGAVIASIVGCVVMAAVCLPLNYFLVYPAYVRFYHMPLEVIIGMYEEILPTISHIPSENALFNCLLVFNVPFTFFKGLLDAIICFFIYKPLSPVIHGRKK